MAMETKQSFADFVASIVQHFPGVLSRLTRTGARLTHLNHELEEI
jgi:hypothetical protein